MRIAIITAHYMRHKYFANTLARHFGTDVVLTLSERKFYDPKSDAIKEKYSDVASKEEQELWDWHFGLREKMEEEQFSDHTEFLGTGDIHEIETGTVNEESTCDLIRSYNPDVIAVFGSGLLKKCVLEIPKYGVINNHMGLSPYYRGSGTNFWPLHNEEPEYVGATIHYIDEGVDSGDIIHQCRPLIEEGDNQHSIGNKAIMKGTEIVCKTLEEVASGFVQSEKQKDGGTMYTRSDFSPKSIKHLKELLEDGLIEKYLIRMNEVWPKVSLVNEL